MTRECDAVEALRQPLSPPEEATDLHFHVLYDRDVNFLDEQIQRITGRIPCW